MKDAPYIAQYLKETEEIARTVDQGRIAAMVQVLRGVKAAKGRLFVLGVGGSAGNASHAVNDFRKIGGIETYAPTDNVSELTARINDIGWDQSFTGWLEVSQLRAGDALLVLSVGGGGPNVSQNLVKAMDLAKAKGAKICAIVSRDGGYAAQIGDAAVIIPVLDKDRITPHAEGWQAVVWHLVVNALVLAEA
jgi:D-sedoheptulose 7-phosphate isomerase